jgi:hypothetical protein
VERELLRLSVVAFAMLNRNRQWVREIELDADLKALLPESFGQVTSGIRAPLTAAEIVLGRFFFVHEARATRDMARLRSYEFLHATFGEYLIARLMAKELAAMAQLAQVVGVQGRSAQPTDAFLHALLSFSPLTIRGTAISFLRELLEDSSEEDRDVLRNQLLDLFRGALNVRRESLFTDYQPAGRSVPARHAAYAANLLLLVVLVGRQVTGSEMFQVEDVVKPWRDLALLWRSQLSSEGFTGLIYALSLERAWNGDRREIILTIQDNSSEEPISDLYWTALISPAHGERGKNIWEHASTGYLWRVRHFICDYGDDLPVAALETFRRRFGGAITSIYGLWPERAVSPADALIALMLLRAEGAGAEELVQAYETCLRISLHYPSLLHDDSAAMTYLEIVSLQLSADANRLPSDWLLSVEKRIGGERLSAAAGRDSDVQSVPRPPN